MAACSEEKLPRFWSSSWSLLSRSTSTVSSDRGSDPPKGEARRLLRRDPGFLITRIVRWYLGLALRILEGLREALGYLVWAPTLWISVWVILRLPASALRWFLGAFSLAASDRPRNRRCVLITGGSTVQAVHLARNFHRAGARVVVCELEGLFGLARFSTACSKFYTVPRPGQSSAVEYARALRDIVVREKAGYFVPVSASSTAYYDALAKPHLEPVGCECFVPGAGEVTALDDPLELLRRCRLLDLPTPDHFVLRSGQDVSRLYADQHNLRTGRYVMLAAGPAGMRDRAKILLPSTARELRSLEQEISEARPWVVIRDPGGEHFITCTTVKASRVVANVTCRVDEARGLIPEDRPEVTRWLDLFFGRPFGAKINGHLSFRLALDEDGGRLISIGCKVGISFPYVCHTGIHPRLLWKPCRHFSRQNSNSAPFPVNSGSSNVKRPEKETATRFCGTVLDKREVLFVYWDPLPYCAYYHLQLPFRRVAGAIRAQPAQHNPPLAVVQ